MERCYKRADESTDMESGEEKISRTVISDVAWKSHDHDLRRSIITSIILVLSHSAQLKKGSMLRTKHSY